MAQTSTYEPSLGERITDELAKGRYLKDVAKEIGVAPSTVLGWAAKDICGFRELYARAREAQMEAWSHELTDLADSADDHENVNSVRLRVDTRKWLMARILPKRYGDKLGIGAADGLDSVTVRVLPAQEPVKPKSLT